MADPIDVRPLSESPVFAGIPLEERASLIADAKGMLRRYPGGSLVRRAGDGLDFCPVVVSGRVQASLPQGGLDRIVSLFGPGDSFAEAVASSLRRCPVDIRALEDTVLLCIPAAGLRACSHAWASTLHGNLMSEMSKKVLVLSRSLAVLSEPRLSDRVLAYLDTLPRNADGSVTVPFGRREWAACLRVADKSLIRELKVMQDDGVIEVDGRTVRVLRQVR